MSGHVYELLKEKEVPFPLIADSISEYAGTTFSHCKDMEPEAVTEQVNDFIELMKKYGAETGIDEGIPYFILSDTVRLNYFKHNFECFKEAVSEINTVTDFISKIDTISNCIDDTMSNCIYYSGSLQSMDSWFKNAEMTKYYIGNVVFVHY